MMMNIRTFDAATMPSPSEKETILNFLFQNLDAYGDPKADIEKCMDYALKVGGKPGGLIVTSWDAEKLTGAVILNNTGMKGYIPENILVYIATHPEYRGKGLGKQLMNKAIEATDGDIALHVEADNPAKRLYERMGFTNKYLEMRLKKPA